MIDNEALFRNYFDRFSQLLPVKVITVDYENFPEFKISGENFGFYTLASWRITKNNQYICGDGDYEESTTYNVLKELVDSNIVKITYQSNFLKNDPVFHFSNGYIVEIFSTFGYEPWTFDSICGFIEGCPG